MIAMSALVRPTAGIRPVRQLEQSLRRDYESVPVTPHRFLVRFADGPVLITDELGSLRVDVVVSDERSARHFEDSFRTEIAVRLEEGSLDVSWSRPATVPQPLR
ncbi:hypothetical protein IFT72_07025 [Frigoribacterium sp. CFBP 8754]|uniref:hypothetical protein n=1 Tax=Frigoribacterium sp. CFBP 8754 TaxID=2775290 RepID=UPI00178544D0|nr:hypothetical protein [Frigoribacterium sp. CFBP 8754]MBD8659944.1 hypothetical protein [Frigoribacterium sp. CFBP 8754]